MSPTTISPFPSGGISLGESLSDCAHQQYPSGRGIGPLLARALGVGAFLGGLARGMSLLDDLFGDLRRGLLVVREMLLERSASRGDGAQVGRVLEHFRH